jgi:hypothetical protein
LQRQFDAHLKQVHGLTDASLPPKNISG